MHHKILFFIANEKHLNVIFLTGLTREESVVRSLD